MGRATVTTVTLGIAIMGGTFDPIHVGHLAAAEEARDALGLTRVLFVPAGRPPHREAGTYSAAEDRAAMVALAIADNASFELSRIEIDRAGPSYTADTVREIATGLDPDERERLTLVQSAETLAGLPGWHEPARLLASVRVAVVPRGGYAPADPGEFLERLPGPSRITVLEGAQIGISSSEIRRRVAAGRTIRYLVPAAVADYIATHRLYRPPSQPRSTNQ